MQPSSTRTVQDILTPPVSLTGTIVGWLGSPVTPTNQEFGSGSAFASVTPTSTSQSVSWSSVPAAVVPGGLNQGHCCRCSHER